MIDRYPGLVLGYHGCNRSVADRVISGVDQLQPSTNPYDWLGHGIYFWENNSQRALEWAIQEKAHPREGRSKITEPAVIGAVLDLGICLNLSDSRHLSLLPEAFLKLEQIIQLSGLTMPVNRSLKESKDVLLRDLDCAVIELLHKHRQDNNEPEFDSTRGTFTEGEALFPGAAIQKGNHIQICIRNTQCIRGYFHPKDL